MADTINWEAKYLEQIEARLEDLGAGQKRLEAKIDQQGKDLRAEIKASAAPTNRLVWATFAAVLIGLVKLLLFTPHP